MWSAEGDMSVVVERAVGFILVRFDGNLSIAELAQAADLLDAVDRASPGIYRLIDLTAVSGVNLDFGAIARFAEDRRRWSLARRVKAAILVGSDVMFGLARMYEQMLDNPEISVDVFRNRTAAMAWLGIQGEPVEDQ
jgi:hypothetical protein